MDWLKNDLKRYTWKGLVLLACLALLGGFVLLRATEEVALGDSEKLLVWLLLTYIAAKTSSQHALGFFKNGSGASFPEALIFLAIVTLGPYHGALLGIVDMFLSNWRLRAKPTNYLLNLSNTSISVYTSGVVYYSSGLLLQNWVAVRGASQEVLIVAVPIVSMALTYYMLQLAIPAMVSVFNSQVRIRERIRDTFPWEPVSLLACAIIAGLINYSFVNFGSVATAVVMLGLLPIPIVIYYTFKTYHDKLGEQQAHYQKLTSVYDSILEMLAMAIDAKDDVTHDHIQRVKLFARRMGEATGLSELEIEALKAGALLHDIGKIGVPAYILNKPGKLTEHEFEQMKMHTIIGADMLSNVDFRYPVVPIVRHHHERWDGRGYPDGLKGDAIPITARILTLVDNYDALRSDRPYKTGMTREQALDFINQNSGTFFDPTLVEKFLSMVDELEVEAATFKAPPSNKRSKVESAAMANARPAAGFDIGPQVDRAAAALNSIAETNQRVTALYELSRTLSSILSVEDTVAILTNRLSKLVPFTTCAIALFDGSRSEFEIVHATGLHAERFIKRRMPAEAGITGWVITNQRPMYNTNPVLDLAFLGTETASAYKGVVVFPLIKNEQGIGAIALYSTEISAYASEHIQLMESISEPAADAISNALTFEQAQRSAFTDSATGLANERALITQFERERARSERLGTALSLIAVEVNHFGFASSDQVSEEQTLTQLGRLIRKQLRETDVIARYDSNCLVAVLPESGQHQAAEISRRIATEIAIAGFGRDSSVRLGSGTGPDYGSNFRDLFESARANSFDVIGAMADLGFTPVMEHQTTKAPS
ncbi:MAG TPA: HD domain-containing phosphohydrolase [Blastocatellia bacterium]|nr:HD domain-containing phosphohydrolase [Blastocatellia bacterium]